MYKTERGLAVPLQQGQQPLWPTLIGYKTILRVRNRAKFRVSVDAV